MYQTYARTVVVSASRETDNYLEYIGGAARLPIVRFESLMVQRELDMFGTIIARERRILQRRREAKVLPVTPLDWHRSLHRSRKKVRQHNLMAWIK